MIPPELQERRYWQPTPSNVSPHHDYLCCQIRQLFDRQMVEHKLMGERKLGSLGLAPPGIGAWLTHKNSLLPYVGYHAEFGPCRSNGTSIRRFTPKLGHWVAFKNHSSERGSIWSTYDFVLVIHRDYRLLSYTVSEIKAILAFVPDMYMPLFRVYYPRNTASQKTIVYKVVKRSTFDHMCSFTLPIF